MENRSIKEPIRKKWIWIVLVIITLGVVPWYFPDAAKRTLYSRVSVMGIYLDSFFNHHVRLFKLALCK